MSVVSAPEEQIRTSSRTGLRDSVLGTRNLMTVAALAVVGSILAVPLSIFTPIFVTSPKTILIACAVMGVWMIPYVLGGIIVPKPGAFLITGLILGIIGTFSTGMGPAAIIGSLIGAAMLEIPMALFLYRKWTWWSYGLAATVFGGLNAVMYSGAYNITVTTTNTVLAVLLSLASCYLALCLGFLLKRALARAGVGITR